MRFRGLFRLALASFGLAFGLVLPAQQTDAFRGQNPALPLFHADNGVNSAKAQAQHYVVLVSLDGFRWDYAQRDGATQLLALGKQGVWAPNGMLPSYPSLTFPNHYTLVTGLYPEHHGLVANSFYDETRQARYAMSDAKAVTDGAWYGGTPLWSCREPGHAHGLLLLAWFRGQNRRVPADLVCARSTRKSRPLPRSSRRGSTMP